MTTQFIFAVKDRAIGAFGQPFFLPSKGLAIRSFIDEVNRDDENNPMRRHPDDFSLYCLGVFDSESGAFGTGESFPERLMHAATVIKSE